MKKTSIQKKLYEVPSLKEHPLTTRKFFAVSPDGYNPGGYVPDMVPVQTETHLSMTITSEEKGSSIAYSQEFGWAIIPDMKYQYVSYYPYLETNKRDEILIDYCGQKQVSNNSTSELASYDYMYTAPTFPLSKNELSLSFNHIGSLVNLKIAIPEEYQDTTFRKLKLVSDKSIFASAATYSIQSIVENNYPILSKRDTNIVMLTFGQNGIKPDNGFISAWILMLPINLKDQNIKVHLYKSNNNVTTLVGDLISESNQEPGKQYTYNVNTNPTGSLLPDAPAQNEKLHILLFGHSFGVDCTQYLPNMTIASGITNVHYGRYYHSDCRLSTYWSEVENGTEDYYQNNEAGSTAWVGANRKIEDVLLETPWDVIIFQQYIGFAGEGNYKSYQPYLDSLSCYVTRTCEKAHNKVPVIGWNIFWGYNSTHKTDYDRDATLMYYANVNAALEMMADTEIRLIVAPGTGVQNARGTSLNIPGSEESPSPTKLFTRDGFHASEGIGRNVSACVWYQTLIAPIYGTDITNNTYRPTSFSFELDKITDSRAPICWKCAVEAVKHPFEVTLIEE